MNLSLDKILPLISIILVSILLMVFETIIYLKSQYHQGLDKAICKCKGLNNRSKAKIINGTSVGFNDLQWIASIFIKQHNTENGIFY